jgi:pimeloyl-ACP methyl ester carboxylesterase
MQLISTAASSPRPGHWRFSAFNSARRCTKRSRRDTANAIAAEPTNQRADAAQSWFLSSGGHLSIAAERCSATALLDSHRAAIRVYELDGNKDGLPIVFGHGCGFAAGTYLNFLSALKGSRVFAFDARGHGGSAGPDHQSAGGYSLSAMAADLALVGEFAASKTGRRPHYVGHSMNGATALWLLAFGDASMFSGFTLFEPAVLPACYHNAHVEAESKHRQLITRCARRRPRWKSRDEYAAMLSSRGPFALWSAAMIADHVRATTQPAMDGTFNLCCAPEVEAAVLEGLMETTLWDALSTIDRTVHVVSADPTREDREWMTTCMHAITRRLPNATLDTLPGTHHISMFAAIEECRDLVETRHAMS